MNDREIAFDLLQNGKIYDHDAYLWDNSGIDICHGFKFFPRPDHDYTEIYIRPGYGNLILKVPENHPDRDKGWSGWPELLPKLDWRCRDQKYWRKRQTDLYRLCGTNTGRAKTLWKATRNFRAANRVLLTEDVIPKADWDRCIDWMEDQISDPCRDNYRVARKGHAGDMKKYQRQQRRGCCGRFDEYVTFGIWPFQKTFLVGCNYGH